jgi:HK97 family phage major capsid protein
MSDNARVIELKDAYRAKQALIDEGMAKGVKIDGQNVEMTRDTADTIRQAMADAKEIKSLIEAATMSKWLDEPDGKSHAVATQAEAPMFGMGKTAAQMFTESDEFKALLRTGGYTMDRPFEFKAFDLPSMAQPRIEQKDVWTGSATSTITRTFGSIQFDPLVPRAQRQARVRDLFPAAATSANLIDYFRVTGFAEGGGNGNAHSVRDRAAADGTSAPVGDATDTFGIKPKSNLQFSSAQAPVRTIAHWEAAHRNVLQDVPQLESTINNELLYGLRLEEDRQILSGSGLNEELTGLLVTAGIQGYTQAGTSGTPTTYEPMSDTLRRAATKAILAYYAPTGYVLHPYDWEQIELQKATGTGAYMIVTNVAIGAEQQIWRQRVVDSPAIPQKTALTGAFGVGAQLYDRQEANIRVAEQHADFFVRNAIAILAEERLALAVKRPESFVKITFLP